MTHPETTRRLATSNRIKFLKEIHRVQRLNRGLHAAILRHDAKLIRHWQILICRHYGITFGDWIWSQRKEDIPAIRLEWKAVFNSN